MAEVFISSIGQVSPVHLIAHCFPDTDQGYFILFKAVQDYYNNLYTERQGTDGYSSL